MSIPMKKYQANWQEISPEVPDEAAQGDGQPYLYLASEVDARIVEMEKDAARYRYLRDEAGNGIMRKLMKEARPDEWNKLVDADMASNGL